MSDRNLESNSISPCEQQLRECFERISEEDRWYFVSMIELVKKHDRFDLIIELRENIPSICSFSGALEFIANRLEEEGLENFG